MAMVAGKGKLRVMAALQDGPLRYSEIHERLSRAINETNLNRARRQLVEDRLVRQMSIVGNQPASDGYELTEAGHDLLDAIDSTLPGWLNGHLRQVGPRATTRRGRRTTDG